MSGEETSFERSERSVNIGLGHGSSGPKRPSALVTKMDLQEGATEEVDLTRRGPEKYSTVEQEVCP